MQIDDATIDNLGKLAKLEYEDKAALASHLEAVLGFFDNLNTLDLDDISLLEDAKTPLRDDEPHDSHTAAAILRDSEYFIVPKIIE